MTCQIPANLFKVSFDRSRAPTVIKFMIGSREVHGIGNQMDELRDYRSGFLTFGGDPGVGKTHFSICIAREHLLRIIKAESEKAPPKFRYAPIYFVESVEMMNECKGRYGLVNDGNIWFYKNHPFLIIDDLGTERDDDKNKDLVYTIINSRYKNDMTTIITTNAQELQNKVVSRLQSGYVIEFGGEDQRGK
jgi:DNA replication protein DnaC